MKKTMYVLSLALMAVVQSAQADAGKCSNVEILNITDASPGYSQNYSVSFMAKDIEGRMDFGDLICGEPQNGDSPSPEFNALVVGRELELPRSGNSSYLTIEGSAPEATDRCKELQALLVEKTLIGKKNGTVVVTYAEYIEKGQCKMKVLSFE